MSELYICEEAGKAIADESKLQIRAKGATVWSNWTPCDGMLIDTDKYDYRLKPVEKWEPWTRETAPKCGEILKLDTGFEGMIIGKGDFGMTVGDQPYTYHEIFEKFTHNGQKCGRRVEA